MRLFILFSIVLLSGCSALQNMSLDTRQLAFTYATAKAINGDQERADRVIELVERGESLSRGPTVLQFPLFTRASARGLIGKG